MTWLVLASVALSLAANSITAFAAVNPFADVPSSSPNAAAIRVLKEEGVLQGYADGSFKPGASINRAELLKIILESRDDSGAEYRIDLSGCFPDVRSEVWYAKYVCKAKSDGIVGGYPDGTFKPDRPVSFAEAAKIFSLAYKQQIQEAGGEWYEGFVRALESSKAIPTSIEDLAAELNRGEMAEIMWRLKKGVTDQPSKGYMNVKYPSVNINLASDKVQVASSCADLQAFSMEVQNAGGGWGRGGGVMKQMRNATQEGLPTAAPAAFDAAQGASDDYSRTNVQVEGVDEADIVKSDGTYLYVVSRNKVRIVKAVPGNAMKEMATIFDDDSNFSPTELYIDGNRLIVIGSSWRQTNPVIMEKSIGIMPPYWNPSLAQVRIFNVADKSKPALERKVSFEGSSVSTRMIGHKLYFVVNQPMRWLPQPLAKPADADVLPSFEDSRAGSASAPVARCGDVMILPHISTPEYLTVAVIDASSPSADVKRETVLGSAQNVYASLQNLYVATTQWVYYWGPVVEDTSIKAPEEESSEKTNLYRFALTSDGIELKAQGSVPGHILNQFSMDEHGNTFRIATTKGELWDSMRPATNNLYVLNQSLETAGKIEDIAPGERIYSVRFMGDRAYMVTFRNTDPLFVISTADPRNPRILGQLKIPGYSDYLHPYDENHLIGFGKDTEEAKDRKDFAWYQGMKIAVFDVTDVSNPKQLHKEIIGDRGTDSPLLSNHKALLFEKDRNLLAFPVTVYEIPDSEKEKNDPGSYGQPVFQGAYVYDFTIGGGFKLKGTISHFTQDQQQKMGDVWYGLGKDIQRIVRMGSALLTVSDASVQSNALGNLAKEGSVEFSDIDDTVYPCGPGVPCAVPMMIE